MLHVDNADLFGTNATFEQSSDVAEETYTFGAANENASGNLFETLETNTAETVVDTTAETTSAGNLFDMDTVAVAPDPMADIIDTMEGDTFDMPSAVTVTSSNPFAADTNILSNIPDVITSTGADTLGSTGAPAGGIDVLGTVTRNNTIVQSNPFGTGSPVDTIGVLGTTTISDNTAQSKPFGGGDFQSESGINTGTGVQQAPKQDGVNVMGILDGINTNTGLKFPQVDTYKTRIKYKDISLTL